MNERRKKEVDEERKKVVVDTADSKAEGPRTDASGCYELLLKSRCPFCAASVYLAKDLVRDLDGLIAMHERVEVGGCCRPFDVLLTADPHRLIDEVLRCADRAELELFMARSGETEGGSGMLH